MLNADSLTNQRAWNKFEDHVHLQHYDQEWKRVGTSCCASVEVVIGGGGGGGGDRGRGRGNDDGGVWW